MTYATELTRLAAAVDAGRNPSDELDAALTMLGGRPAKFVGSGGAFAVALLARDLHTSSVRAPASATTPLLSVQEPIVAGSGCVLFSSSGKNPDAAVALGAARAGELHPVVMITRRQFVDLPARVRRHDPYVVTIDSPKDGFLATGSVAAVSTALVTAHGHSLPATSELIPETSEVVTTLAAGRLLVLYGWGLECVARDIETRVAELGIGTVELADYRNLAHGRHVGLSRNVESTQVLALIDPATESIASQTLAQLPTKAQVFVIRSELEWPASAVELLLRAMHVPLWLDDRDPAKPRVPQFGRKLYNLPIARTLPPQRWTPVERKRAAGGFAYPQEEARRRLSEWLERTSHEQVGALILDYDGTCCTTDGRFDPPDLKVQEAILRALELGLSIGFASGRGKSLPLALREWLPERSWPSVTVGLYNGSLQISLDEDVPDQSESEERFGRLAGELEELVPGGAKLEVRTTQLTVESTHGLSGHDLLPLVEAAVARVPRRLKAHASAHSVDVIDLEHSKAAVLEAVRSRLTPGTGVLAVGDSGGRGGNDFELLAATPLSVSVDTVSSDLSRCWNLDVRGEKGPALLQRYLNCLRKSSGGVRFVWNERE